MRRLLALWTYPRSAPRYVAELAGARASAATPRNPAPAPGLRLDHDPFEVTAPTGEQFRVADRESILLAAERDGIVLPFGCRRGNCRRCSLTLTSGAVQDLRHGGHLGVGAVVQTCVTTPTAHVRLAP